MAWEWLSIKPRSKLGKFLDRHDLTQEKVSKVSGVSKSTLSRLCKGNAFHPSFKNQNKIITALRKLTGKNIDPTDFWI
ncbi:MULTISPECIES: helix-turn-helix domain-containing protein [Bacillus]|uniref:helix-turn-helix domain-containing protein n=1 Tax=Bacillus TaxID=1386 RepID=UPI00119DACC1|nr:helix-turn-helix transcriptional regulator [Bacillus thuringiensis]